MTIVELQITLRQQNDNDLAWLMELRDDEQEPITVDFEELTATTLFASSGDALEAITDGLDMDDNVVSYRVIR